MDIILKKLNIKRMKYCLVALLLAGATACNSPSSSTPSLNPTHINPVPKTSPPVNITGAVGIVWNGPGACTDGCIQGAADAVTGAGFTVRYVNEQTPTTSPENLAAIFLNAKVWVMPGGHSNKEVGAMTPALITALQQFISNGGGYVGWCAGSFAATAKIGTTGLTGLGIFPGDTIPYITKSEQNAYGGSIEKLTWMNDTHYFYLEGGSYMTNLPSSVEVISRYDDQVSVAAARTTYGNGRVYLSGVHPEAPTWWWTGTGIVDPDGSDQAYAIEMIKWSAHLE